MSDIQGPAGGEDDGRQSTMDAEVFASGTSRGDDRVAWASAVALLVEGEHARRTTCCSGGKAAAGPSSQTTLVR